MKNFFPILVALLHLLLFIPLQSFGANLLIQAEEKGGNVSYTVSADEAEALAGLKVSMSFPAGSLTYQSYKLDPALKNFMHLVNDKKPGKLILVAASANGVSGKPLNLFSLVFKRTENQEKGALQVTGYELMSDSLKKIPVEKIIYPQEKQ